MPEQDINDAEPDGRSYFFPVSVQKKLLPLSGCRNRPDLLNSAISFEDSA
jgi:hypothetical protein